MGKIKGWEKIGNRIWGNKIKFSLISIRSVPNGWVILYSPYGISSFEKVLKKFKTKKQALKFAKVWMKKHPKG